MYTRYDVNNPKIISSNHCDYHSCDLGMMFDTAEFYSPVSTLILLSWDTCEIDNLVNTLFPSGAMCYPGMIEYALNWQAGEMGYYSYKMKMDFSWTRQRSIWPRLDDQKSSKKTQA